EVKLEPYRPSHAICKALLDGIFRIGLRPGRGDGAMSLGKHGNLGIHIIERCTGRLFVHKIIALRITDEELDAFLTDPLEVELTAEELYRQGPVWGHRNRV